MDRWTDRYITWHDLTWHSMAWHYIALFCIRLHYIALHYTLSLYILYIYYIIYIYYIYIYIVYIYIILYNYIYYIWKTYVLVHIHCDTDRWDFPSPRWENPLLNVRWSPSRSPGSWWFWDQEGIVLQEPQNLLGYIVMIPMIGL